MERAAQIAHKNNYLFLQPQYLELLLEVNMALRVKHGWSALQSAFTASKFRATVISIGAPKTSRKMRPASYLGSEPHKKRPHRAPKIVSARH
jgi:hypothetical protein